MAIFGIGTDLVDINRIERAYSQHGDKFAHRILSERELLTYEQRSNKVTFIAKRFAAKEAISKALGTGMRKGIGFQQLEVLSDELGKPRVELTGEAKKWAEDMNVSVVHLSISDEVETAMAFAIAETK